MRTCTLRDLVPEGVDATAEDPAVAPLNASARLLGAVEAAIALFEVPPARTTVVETPWADVPPPP